MLAEGRFPPEVEPVASSADRRRHVHNGAGIAVALATVLVHGGVAGATAIVNTVFTGHVDERLLLAYFSFVLLSLLLTWRDFDRSSIAASTLFALTAVAMLMMYATFGTYYLGAQFKPRITDLVSAFYYAMVTMSTVGYGDIVP